MRILELFSGTHSIGKVFNDDEIISVDLDNRFNPTHNIDIMNFDYKQYPVKHFDYIHASPPCILYSQNQITWYGRKKRHNITKEMVTWDKDQHIECIKLSDEIVLKALEIIDYFKPKYWTMENPYHNNWCNIKYRPFMKDFKYEIVDYCMYDYSIKKPTLIYNNFDLKLKKCDKKHKHLHWGKFKGGGGNPFERYIIPHELCKEIKKQILI
jgi:hypothetical protein